MFLQVRKTVLSKILKHDMFMTSGKDHHIPLVMVCIQYLKVCTIYYMLSVRFQKIYPYGII